MAKIKNQILYPLDQIIIGDEYLIGTDSNGKTKTYPLASIFKYIQDNGGLDGDDGSDGTGIGIPISDRFTWLKWADDNIGTNMTDSPDGKAYIGIAVNKLLAESVDPNSSDPTYYVWTAVGEVISYIGADGKTYYIHVKYSKFPDGSEMSDSSEGMSYIGIAYRQTTDVESDNPNDYEWSLINSDIKEEPKILYYWFKFADDINGSNMSDSPVDKDYMGIAVDKDTPIESDDPIDYAWNLIEGLQGYIGPDGKTYWIWTKWAKSKIPTPSEMFDDPDGMTYMGIAVNKDTPTESTDYRDYEWSKIPQNNTVVSQVDQNNIIKVIQIPIEELNSFDKEGVSEWINNNGVIVAEDEILGIEVLGIEEPEIPTLDNDIALTLALGAVGETTAVLNWNANGDSAIVRYEALYVRTKGGSYQIVSLNNVLTTTLTSLDSGVPYEAYVLGYDTLGNSKKSNIVTFSTEEVFVASTPNIQADAVTDTTIDLSWNVETSFGADRFELYEVGNGTPIYNGPAFLYQIIGLTQSTLHQYYVIAYSGVTSSNNSATIDVTTLQTVDPPLTKPTLVWVSATTSYVMYSIGIPALEVSRVTGYQLQYRQLGLTDWISSTLTVSNLQRLEGLDDDTTYELQVRSIDGNVVSEWSDILLATTDQQNKAGLSLHLKTILTPTEIANGYVGQLSVFDGEPNTDVTIHLHLTVTEMGYNIPGNIEFKNTVIGKGNVLLSSQTKEITVTLDANGKYEDIYSLNEGVFGAEYTVFSMLLLSVNGISTYDKSDLIIHTQSINIF